MHKLSVRSDDTEIYIINHPDPRELNVLLERDIRNCGDKQNRSTNVKALMTHWDMFNHSSAFNSLLEWIEKSFGDCKLHTFCRQTEYKLNSLWGMIYKEGDHTIPHDHLPSFFSFVYFVKVSNNSSPLMFSASSTYIKPEVGKIVFFPSYLKHYVPEQGGNDERITISGNIIATE
jgi:hypothetical protein